jgi:hypothetical protein
MATLKRKRNDRSSTQEIEILSRYDALGLSVISQREAAVKLGIPQSSLCKILKRRDSLKDAVVELGKDRKRRRQGKFEDIDEALLMWFKQTVAIKAPINRDILKEKARAFAKQLGNDEFSASDGWMTRWQDRYGVVYKKVHGEKDDSDVLGAETWLEQKWPSISARYSPEHIYNLDETALYYRATPDTCMMFKNSEAYGGAKKLKDRLSVLLLCNMTGSVKVKPLVIGKAANPRCFKNIKNKPVNYASNANAWMTSAIFEDFLRQWDEDLKCKKLRIALILDNCPAHPSTYNPPLKNIELVFLPPKTTAMIQPLDQGIIKTFKTFFRSDMRRRIIRAIDDGEGTASEVAKRLTVLDALHMTKNAWNKVSSVCIQNCFRKSQLTLREDLPSDHDELPTLTDLFPGMADKEIAEWLNVDADVDVTQPLSDSDIIRAIRNEEEGEGEVGSDDENNNEPADEPVTRRQTMDALKILRRAVEQSGGSDEQYNSLYRLENALLEFYVSHSRQRTLDEF